MNATVIAEVGAKFADILESWLTPEEWREMLHKNSTVNKGTDICASHDYCDANMAMLEAFTALDFRACCDIDENDDPQSHADSIKLWNAAWEWATTNRLTEVNQ